MSDIGSSRSNKRRDDRVFGTQPKSPRRMSSQASTASSSADLVTVAGRLIKVELENFMCHGNLKVEFDIHNNNCFYVGGPNGSGKSALFSAINIGLGGGGKSNDRGNSVKQYIKNGKNNAKIRITLSNTGQGRCEKYRKDTDWEKYGNVIIVERHIGLTASTYSIKTTRDQGRDKKEYLVSHKKTDLDVILARFGIELNNPIYWLSQDKARSFLSQTDPGKMFQIFMDASELDKTKEEYQKAAKILKDVQENIDCILVQLTEQRKEFNKMKELLDKKQKEKDLLEKVQRLTWLSHVAPLRDAEDKKKIMEEKVKETEKRITALKQEQSRTALEIQEHRNALGNLAENTSVNKREGDERSEFLQELNGEIEPLKLECKHLESDIIRYQGDIENAEKEVQIAHRKIQEQERRMNSNEDRQNLERYQKTVEQFEQLQIDDKEQKRQLEEAKKELESELAVAHKAALAANEQVNAAHNEYGVCRDDLQHIMETEKNMLARFGNQVPMIIKIIEANANRFSHKPKGPIGSYIKVHDKKYLLAVESALKTNLQTFVFDNHRDEQIFKQLLDSQRIHMPQTVIARFGLPPHQTRGYEPDGFLTILNAVDITDIDIRNLLIDLQSIESTILFDSDQVARQVMNGNLPQNANVGFTVTGAQVYGSNRQRGNYRFYACHKQRAQILSDFAGVNKDALRQQIELTKRKFELASEEGKKARAAFELLKRKYDQLDSQQKRIEDGLKNRKGQIINYNRQIERLKESDDGDTVIQAQERLVEEYHDMMRGSQNKIKESKELLEKKKKHLKKLTEKREAFMAESTAILERYQTLENEALELKRKINEATEKNNRCDRSMKKLEDTKEKIMEEERVAVLRQIDKATEDLEGYDGEVPTGPDGNPEEPDYNNMPATDEIFDMLNKRTIELDALHKALDIVPTVEEMQTKKDAFNKAKLLFQTFKGLHSQIKECLNIRQKKFPVIQHAIIMKLKQEFTRLIKFKFTGDLHVNVKKGEIRIKVKPHAGSQNSQESLKDIRGLSGGERSYTTTCFFMALWYIMETPFRCMDEFDVFMDGHMRKTAMDLIVKLATESYSHQQFIFFTPQGINELSTGDHVATFEMPKVRDN